MLLYDFVHGLALPCIGAMLRPCCIPVTESGKGSPAAADMEGSSSKLTWLPDRQGRLLQVTTVDGQVDLKVPGGTQPGTTLVMSKRGVPRLGAESIRGDHQVRACTASQNAECSPTTSYHSAQNGMPSAAVTSAPQLGEGAG